MPCVGVLHVQAQDDGLDVVGPVVPVGAVHQAHVGAVPDPVYLAPALVHLQAEAHDLLVEVHGSGQVPVVEPRDDPANLLTHG